VKEHADKLAVRVYDDAVSPASKAVGETLARAVSTCLRPVDGVLWSANQAMDWIADRLMRLFEADGTAPDGIAKPSIEVEGRVLQHVQIIGPTGDSVLCGQLVALLASDMNREADAAVHPALADVLRNLVPSEARLLTAIHGYHRCIVHIAEARARWIATNKDRTSIALPPDRANERDAPDDPIDPRIEMSVAPLWEKIGAPFKSKATLNVLANMVRLGLLKTEEIEESERLIMDPASRPYSDDLHEWRQRCDSLSERMPEWCIAPQQNGYDVRVKEVFRAIVVEPTPWGEQLGKACRMKEFFEGNSITVPAWARMDAESKANKGVQATK